MNGKGSKRRACQVRHEHYARNHTTIFKPELVVGREYRYPSNIVKLLELTAHEALVETRFGERTTVDPNELRAKGEPPKSSMRWYTHRAELRSPPPVTK